MDLLQSGHPEFDDWRWVSFWYPVRNVVSFKRDVYRRVMKDFSPTAMPESCFSKSRVTIKSQSGAGKLNY